MRTQPFLLAIPSEFRTKKTWSVKINFLFGGRDRDRERGKWETTKIMRKKGCKHVDKIIKFFKFNRENLTHIKQRCPSQQCASLPYFSNVATFHQHYLFFPHFHNLSAFNCFNKSITFLIFIQRILYSMHCCRFSAMLPLFNSTSDKIM